MKKKRLGIEGRDARGWECTKCKDMVLHPEDAQRILLLSKVKKGVSVTVGELGNSFVVRIPKEIAEFYKLSKGEQITMKAESRNKIELEISG
jgi:hypothetical protein